ncbi:MAG: Hpt domain-containing protein [Paracoccaceae bacterium]
MIDWARLRDLRDEITADELREVAELFLQETDLAVDELRHAPDPARLEERLHFLKGGALNLGFRALAALCLAGEKAAAKGDVDAVDIATILATYDESRGQFLQRLGVLVHAA